MALSVNQLIVGGILATYKCTVSCAHCRHKASPQQCHSFITEETLRNVLKKLESMGCQSIHLEGGEPFLFPEELKKAIYIINKESSIELEHVFTNCSWYKNQKEAVALLSELKQLGLRELVVKVGPFQNASIPLKKVQNVIKAAEAAKLKTLLWDIEFYPEVASFDASKPHALKEYIGKFGENYMISLAERFNMTYSGRSFDLYSKYLKKSSINDILKNDNGCKTEFSARFHFHIDLNGHYSFPLSHGLTIDYNDLGKPIDEAKYPHLARLYNEGVAGLLKWATKEHGFVAKQSYISKCHLCFDIRQFLVLDRNTNSPDLQPLSYYQSK